uniref:Putative extracellular protein CSOL_014 n=1 Tax=Pseudococcomyxa simplex TaxID=464287 RepID=A0A7L9QDX7_9CHLO|nr:putative extracellular protein CSOL_014 [Pseudococcomyxa simplex]
MGATALLPLALLMLGCLRGGMVLAANAHNSTAKGAEVSVASMKPYGGLQVGTKENVGYYASWGDWNPSQGALSGIPTYVTTVIMAFCQPDMTFTPGSFAGTGFQYLDENYNTVKQQIANLKQKGTRVLVAVGGANYAKWSALNTGSLASFVKEMGFNGVDIDYEPAFDSVVCTTSSGVPSCTSDAEFTNVILSIRNALPRPIIVSLAAYSIGAYGWGNFATAQPIGTHTGMSYNPLKAQGDKLDLINIMSYDADNQYSPITAYQSYQALLALNGQFSGKIVQGVSSQQECCGHQLSYDELNTYANWLNANNGGGAMLWYLGPRAGTVPGTPTSTQVAQYFCTQFSFGGCSDPLFTCDGCASVGVVASVRDPYAAMAIGQQTVVTSIKTADAALQPPRTYGQPNEEPPFWVEPRQVPIVKLG